MAVLSNVSCGGINLNNSAALTLSDTTITISYQGKTTTQAITVTA